MQVKKIADSILKKAVAEKHLLTLQFDPNSLRSLEKVFDGIEGFSDMTSDKIQFQIPITINADVSNIYDFETNLNNVLKRKPLTNVRFTVIKSVGRPTRITRPPR